MAFCLIPNKANRFKQAIRNGEVDIYALKNMTSKQRREFFGKYFDEADAKRVNIEYEKKLMLKNYERAMVNWASKLTGITKEKKRDLQNRVQNMIKRGELTADNADKMLADLVEYRLGGSVSESEANEIYKLSERVKKLENFTNEEERLAYGQAVYDLQTYATEISTKSPMSKKKYLQKVALDVLALPRAVMASWDLSALLGQGLYMSTSKEFYQSALGLKGRQNIFKVAFSEKNYEKVMADIISRENYDLAVNSGLRITTLDGKMTQREESFMSNAVEKIPFLGQVFRGSDRAYSGFLNQLRMDTYDRLIRDARINGEDTRPGSTAAIEAAIMVNNLTGAGTWFYQGRADGGTKRPKTTVNPWASAIFFSPRKTMSMINNINPATYINMKSKTARQYALMRLISFAGVIASIAALAKLNDDDEFDFETDIRSSNFGKLRVGRMWFDVTGGAFRFLNALWLGVIGGVGKTVTGNDELEIFMKKNVSDSTLSKADSLKEITRFVRNKVAPLPGYIWGLVEGKDFKGDKFDPKKELATMFIPMAMDSILELNDGTITAKEVLVMYLTSAFGISGYVINNIPDWHKKTTKEMIAFRDKVSEKELSEAEKLYGTLYSERLDELLKSKDYQKLTNDEKKKKISKLKEETKQSVFRRYGFNPKKK